MSLTIQLPSKLEEQLREHAAKEGLAPEGYVLKVVQNSLKLPAQMPDREAELLKKAELGISPDFWEEYDKLIEKRMAETITPSELKRLIKMTDKVEEANARRMPYLIELAKIRNVKLEVLIKQLGVHRPSYG